MAFMREGLIICIIKHRNKRLWDSAEVQVEIYHTEGCKDRHALRNVSVAARSENCFYLLMLTFSPPNHRVRMLCMWLARWVSILLAFRPPSAKSKDASCDMLCYVLPSIRVIIAVVAWNAIAKASKKHSSKYRRCRAINTKGRICNQCRALQQNLRRKRFSSSDSCKWAHHNLNKRTRLSRHTHTRGTCPSSCGRHAR